ncbi:MAG: hypothetical protein KBT18_01055, partial [Comamonas sp.]|nr:hypothetical protein [Candidatus Comamonas equi]
MGIGRIDSHAALQAATTDASTSQPSAQAGHCHKGVRIKNKSCLPSSLLHSTGKTCENTGITTAGSYAIIVALGQQ